ncbi:MAG TPA: family 10 glycosylhydrolase, partial [Longimicrobiales bacterium]|nr:family 10 glycosylhydrolase [Longimicrobiales bacterium]
HARGLELHAWFNPFRAGFTAKVTPLAARHVSKRRPDLVRRYGTHYWMDPGEPDARKLALDVITDVVRRYDVDAIHVDDYFYPYLERDARGRIISFPDDASWREHGMATGMTRNDWRRSNIDAFVEQMYRAVRAEKRHVRVGISPFGIWRPGHPATVRGLDAFNELYADTRKWLVNGWADYYAPQLYWRTYAPQQDYATLLQWWSEQNPFGRHIWAGNIPNSVTGGTRGWPATEIVEQVQLTRASGGATGNVHFSATSLVRDAGGVFSSLRTGAYAVPALVPASPWLSDGLAPAPAITAAPDSALHATLLTLRASGEPPSSWIVRSRHGTEWRTLLLPGSLSEVYVDGAPELVVVSPVDRAGVEGAATAVSSGQ